MSQGVLQGILFLGIYSEMYPGIPPSKFKIFTKGFLKRSYNFEIKGTQCELQVYSGEQSVKVGVHP